MSFNTFFKLKNGNDIPALAIGSGANRKGVDLTTVTERVEYTIGLPGVSHIDTAEAYLVNSQVADAIGKSFEKGIERRSFWITSKYWPGTSISFNNGVPMEPFSSDPLQAIDKITGTLGIQYLDLFLLHSADITEDKNGYDLKQAWRYMEDAYRTGKAKNIGVSNFTINNLLKILEVCEIAPAVNQIEFHPYNQDASLVDFCKSNQILVEGYSPLTPISFAKGGPLDPILADLSRKYQRSASVVLLRWAFQSNVLPITSSSHTERIKEYLEVFDFQLAELDFDKIEKVGSSHSFRKTPPMT